MNLLIIHGPNLNMLSYRNQTYYGEDSLEEINTSIKNKGKELGFETFIFQSNSEGDIITKLHETVFNDKYIGVILNAGAYTHYSYAIRDAIELVNIPVIEVHLSNIYNRDEFREKSVIAPVCNGQITGFGPNSYIIAMDAMKLIIKEMY
ncbi:MAG TPA: type II 3-dehydroquinate dehydratase [Tissierellales bacterium]|nr:type II 3-dehydroquinate dehydratase [Tissierellales bacterium]